MGIDGIALVVMGLIVVSLPYFERYRSRQLRALGRDVGSPVSERIRPAVEAKLARRTRAVGAGIVLGGLLTVMVAEFWPGGAPLNGGGWLVVSVAVTSGALAGVVTEVWIPGICGSGARAARTRVPELKDYVPREYVVLAAGLTMAGLVVLVGTLLLGSSKWISAEELRRSPIPVLLVALGVLSLLSWYGIRRVLDAPQRAGDESELYWQDALRAKTLERILLTLCVVALLSLGPCGAALDAAASRVAEQSGRVGPAWSLWVLIGGYALPFVLLTALLLTRPWWARPQVNERFRDRLWNGRSGEELEAQT